MQVKFKYFESATKRWADLFKEAADFAQTIDPERLISISHSEDKNVGVVTV
ncbi:MAG: hypothetical protein AAF085_13195 [Planctomycetota bacterium]